MVRLDQDLRLCPLSDKLRVGDDSRLGPELLRAYRLAIDALAEMYSRGELATSVFDDIIAQSASATGRIAFRCSQECCLLRQYVERRLHDRRFQLAGGKSAISEICKRLEFELSEVSLGFFWLFFF